jgi:hypothetical protein
MLGAPTLLSACLLSSQYSSPLKQPRSPWLNASVPRSNARGSNAGHCMYVVSSVLEPLASCLAALAIMRCCRGLMLGAPPLITAFRFFGEYCQIPTSRYDSFYHNLTCFSLGAA